MRVLLMWLATGLSVALGYTWVARAAWVPHAAWVHHAARVARGGLDADDPVRAIVALAIAACSCFIVCSVVGAGSRAGLLEGRERPILGRLGVVALCCGWLLLGWMRGATVRHGADLAQWQVPRSPTDLVEFEIRSAGIPGARCEVEARPRGTSLDVWLSVPVELCPLAAGQRVRARALDLEVEDRSWWPHETMPETAPMRGVDLAIATDRAWPAQGEGSPGSIAMAELRVEGHRAARGDPAIAFAVASGLGLHEVLSPLDREHLRFVGLSHLIAVSGLHVVLAGWLIQRIAVRAIGWTAGRTRRWIVISTVAAWIPLWIYVVLTGAAPSAIRAALMLCWLGVGSMLGRPPHGLTTLAAVSALMLWWRPGWAFDPGFALSVAAMAAVVTAPRSLGILGLSWRVSWAVAPVSILVFATASPYGVLFNLVGIPLFTVWILPLGIVGSLLLPWFGRSALEPAAWGGQIVLDVSTLGARLPEVPLEATAVAAAFVWIVRRWLPSSARPPTLALVGVIAAVLLHRGHARPAEHGAWYAVGSWRQPTTIAVEEIDGDRVACIDHPGLGAVRWPERLALLGIDRVAGIGPAREADAPHGVELRERLAAASMWSLGERRCTPVERTSIRAAMRACTRRTGWDRVAIAGDLDQRVRCWAGDRWIELH